MKINIGYHIVLPHITNDIFFLNIYGSASEINVIMKALSTIRLQKNSTPNITHSKLVARIQYICLQNFLFGSITRSEKWAAIS